MTANTPATSPAGTSQGIEPDEMYCPECGDVILHRASVCPDCGVSVSGAGDDEDKAVLGYSGYVAIGMISRFVSFLFVPVVLGPVAMFCGVQLYRKHSELAGIAVFVLGGIGLVIGLFLGMLTWTML